MTQEAHRKGLPQCHGVDYSRQPRGSWEPPGRRRWIPSTPSSTKIETLLGWWKSPPAPKSALGRVSNLPNATRQNKFILPKVPVTITPHLDKVYADSCLKSKKQADKSLARIQPLALDATGPLSEALEMVHAVDGDSDQVELDLEKLVADLETLLAFIGNASCQTSNLRRQKIVEDTSKDLISYTAEQEEHFTTQAPMLFGQHFMKNAKEHWD